MNKRIAAGIAGVGILIATMTGCMDKATEPFKDAPRSGETNNAPASVITFPDGFSNASRKCDGPNMIYSAYHGDQPYAAIQVVANDPRCN